MQRGSNGFGERAERSLHFLRCHVLLGEKTEWVETVEDGWNMLVGANDGAIIKVANDFEPKGEQRDVFGDGKASARIVEVIGGLR